MWRFILLLFLIMPSSFFVFVILTVIVWRGIRDEKKHPEKYRNRKRDNNCYWID